MFSLQTLRQKQARLRKFSALMLALNSHGSAVTAYEASMAVALAVPYALTLQKYDSTLSFGDFRKSSNIWISLLSDNPALGHHIAILANRSLVLSCLPRNQDKDSPQPGEMACHAGHNRDRKALKI